MAAPPKLTEETLDQLVALIRDGNTEKDALAVIGVSDSTAWRWKQRAEERPGSIYGLYRERVAKAMAEQSALRIRQITLAGSQGATTTTTVTKMEPIVGDDGEVSYRPIERTQKTVVNPPDWKASAWMLERLNPRFNRREQVEAMIAHIPPEMLDRGVAELLRIVQGDEGPSHLLPGDDEARALLPKQ